MDTFFQKHREGITLVSNLLFWLVACFFYVRFSVIRPMCISHIYKEFVCFGLIIAVVLVTRWITIPKLFLIGRYSLFWIASVSMFLAATVMEIVLISPDVHGRIFFDQLRSSFLPYFYG